MLDIVLYPDPILRKKCRPLLQGPYLIGDPKDKNLGFGFVDENGKPINEWLQKLVADMKETLHKTKYGIGLAAPQVGVDIQLFIVSIKKDEDPIVAINPTYGEPRGEMTGEEGCLSIPGVGAEITRPASVLVKGLYLNGDSFQFRAEPTPEDPNGVLSRVCQHEIDHLNGKLFFERISSTIIRRKIDPALEDLEWRYKRKRKGK